MCEGVKEVFSFASEQRSLLENDPLSASVSQGMLPTLHLAQRHSQLGNRHYERKIMAQHFSPGGTMGLFSPCHGVRGRAEAAELCFWTCPSITERLCAMCICQQLGTFCPLLLYLLPTSAFTFSFTQSLLYTSALPLFHQSSSLPWHNSR